MRQGMRWALVAALDVLAFAGVFLLFYAADIPLLPTDDDNRVAVAVAAATVAATVGGTWGAWWVPRAERDRAEQVPAGARVELPNATVTVHGAAVAEAPPSPLVRMGDLPREPLGFQPRVDLLTELALAAGRESLTVVHAVTGARGVGKTQLAAAYARRRVEEGWPVVAWITAENSGQLVSGLAELADQLGVRDPADDAVKAARAALTWIGRNPDPCLIVLDNATDPDEVAGWLPTTGRAQVVVTATSQAFQNLAGALVDVTVFSEEEALAFLRLRTGAASDDGAAELAEELGRLPLALSQAAQVIRQRGTGYRAYLARLRTFSLESVLDKVPGERYPHRVAEAMLIAAEQVEDRNPGLPVRTLLETLSVLSPAGVQKDLLYGAVRQLGADDPTAAEDALGVLAQASLATDTGADAVSMHRLVQRVVRERAGDGLRAVVAGVARYLEDELVPSAEAWERREYGGQLVDQIDALWRSANRALSSYGEEELSCLLRLRRWAAHGHLAEVGGATRALALAGETSGDCVAALGEEAAATQFALETEGDVCEWAGRTERAIAVRSRLMELKARSLGPNDEYTLVARWDLARSYDEAGRFALSVPLYEELERDVRQLLGADHADARDVLADLAKAYAAAGQLSVARRLVERMNAEWTYQPAESEPSLRSWQSLADGYASIGRWEEGAALLWRRLLQRQVTAGPDTPEIVWTRNSLAHKYLEAARFTDARFWAKYALRDAERVFGARSADTTTIRATVAVCLQRLARYEEAVALFRQVVEERLDHYGPEHPRTLAARRDLVWSIDDAGRSDEAYGEQTLLLADHERLLGKDHPGTFEARRFLVQLCIRTGRIREAIETARTVLSEHESGYGAHHLQTVGVRLVLAEALTAAGRHDEAVSLLTQILSDTARNLSSGHRHAFTARSELAGVLLARGDLAEGRALCEENLAERTRMFGEDHISVVWARGALAHALLRSGLHDEALALYQGVAEEVTRVFGHQHTYARLARRWLARAYGEAGHYAERLDMAEADSPASRFPEGRDDLLTLAARTEEADALVDDGHKSAARWRRRDLHGRYVRLLGPDHPNTIGRLADMAGDYRSIQRRFKALRLRRRVLRAHELRSGRTSPDSVNSRRQVGHAYGSVGLRPLDAVIQGRLLDDMIAEYGPDHVDTWTQRAHWAEALRRCGRLCAAMEIARVHVEDHERRFGEDHPWTLDARRFAAATARRTGRVRTGLREYEALLADRVRVHGPDHVFTWEARVDHARAALWALHPHRAVVLHEAVILEAQRLFGLHSRQVEKQWPRHVLLCLATGHWRRVPAALRLRPQYSPGSNGALPPPPAVAPQSP
ncbi:tetratricopeptide repeat protein [Streptomyces sp. NPDC005760]|uniref:tetratricopeptide repeat protein n=1 Tax=Streptomyces sp. NPDC005760 TaxID=3156718 RepID=UPI0033BFEDC1